jgi:enamine deaminase RidA (YjgF/YER057c/UK114 family)
MTSQPKSISTGVAHHVGRYGDAVRVPTGHDQIFVSDTPGLDADGNVPADFSDEARQAWGNVEQALSLAGASLTDIVSVRQWLTDPDDVAAYVDVRKEFIQHEPAFMLGVPTQLVWPGLRIEIEVTAVVLAGASAHAGTKAQGQ